MKDAIDWLKQFSRKKLINDKNIIQLLEYNDYSLWWLLEWFLEHGSFYCLDIRNSFKGKKLYKNYIGFYANCCRKIFRKVLWYGFMLFNKSFDFSKKSVVCVSSLHQYIYDSGKIIKDDKFVPIMRRLSDDYNMILLDIPFRRELGIKAFFKGIRRKNIIFVPIEHFIGLKELKNAYNNFRKYKKVWQKLRQDNNILLSINPLLANFDFFFSKYLLMQLLDIEAYNTFFKRTHIDAVCTYDVFSPTGLKIRISFNGKMFGIQSGIWCTRSVEYITWKHELSTYPLLDYIIVFDDKTKQTLIQYKHIKHDRLIVVGNPRNDDLYYKLKYYKLHLSAESIVLISHIIYDNDEYSLFLDIIFRFFGQYPNEKKIIKPHPAEKISLYKSLIKQYNIKNIIINTSDIIFSLAEAKFVIGAYSTGLSEAILLGKPTVSVDISGKGYNAIVGTDKTAKTVEDLVQHFNHSVDTMDKMTFTPYVYDKIAEVITEKIL